MRERHSEDVDELALLRKGDQGAFTRLVRKYHASLLKLSRAITGELWAEEVVQDSWMAVYVNLHKFEGRSSLKTWLFTIVRNAARSKLRKEQQERIHDTDSDATLWINGRVSDNGTWPSPLTDWRTDSPEELLQVEELRHCIEDTLTRLSGDQKAVFLLRDVEQMNLDDICNILELSSSNVRVLLHRARMQLLGVIEKYQETGEC